MDIRTRYFVDELKVHNEVHKWMWIVLMGVSFVTATNRILEYGWTSRSGLDQATLFASYLIYICFIYRFFVGDRKIVENFYGSLAQALGESGVGDFRVYLRSITRPLLVFDGLPRVLQLLVFLPVASKIHNPIIVTLGLAFLLFLNSLFCIAGLVITQLRSDELKKVTLRVLDVSLSGRKYRKRWAINNSLCFALILAVIYAENIGLLPGYGIQAILGVLALNCVVDLTWVGRLYLPDYETIYRPLKYAQPSPAEYWSVYKAANARPAESDDGEAGTGDIDEPKGADEIHEDKDSAEVE